MIKDTIVTFKGKLRYEPIQSKKDIKQSIKEGCCKSRKFDIRNIMNYINFSGQKVLSHSSKSIDMKILLVYPQYPDTFWSFKHALRFIGKKAVFPPMGLLTIASMLPKNWNLKLIDLNVTTLKNEDILWADYIFLGGMTIQKASAREVITRCTQLDRKVVAGGPLFSAEPDGFKDVHHLVLDEAEITLPDFLHDLEQGCPKPIYRSSAMADIETSPVPMWELINFNNYTTMCLQYSRGCPYDCEFCEITLRYGHKPRTKSIEKIIHELEVLYRCGWRKGVFFVDDNFIGNKRLIKNKLLPAIIEWMEIKQHPFVFSTQASINIAEDDALVNLMVDAGFDTVFVGIETPDKDCLIECGKYHNANIDLQSRVDNLQSSGLQVQAGFIVGFDNDKSDIFSRMSQFINESGIVTSMVGLLNAPPGTRLYNRLVKENRIVSKEITGDNTDFSMNFIPKMEHSDLVEGYRNIIRDIYGPDAYYKRVRKFLNIYQLKNKYNNGLSFSSLRAVVVSIFTLGMKKGVRWHFWNLIMWTIFKQPRLLPHAMMMSIYGAHFMKHFGINTISGQCEYPVISEIVKTY